MKVSPWPTDAVDSVLFIIDAAHQVEQDLLEHWLANERPAQGFGGKVERIVMPIAGALENIATDALSQLLDRLPDTLVVPVRVVWLTSLDEKTTTPRLRDLVFGNPRHPGVARARRILRQNSSRAQCIAAEPANLSELRQRFEDRIGDSPSHDQLADFIVGQAGLALDIAERRLRGSRYKVPRRVARDLQSSPRFKAALENLSKETQRPLPELQAEAAEILKELVASPRPFWLDLNYALNRKIATLGYKTQIVVDETSLERIRQITKQYPTAFLCTHKTHVDFPALNKTFFDHDFPATHTLGGVNMAFAGLGFVARRAGVIFIRRSFQDDPLYKLILRQYVGYLMEKRFPLSWAFEGTRSRVGKLMPPKYGMLKYVLEAAHTTGASRLHFIPVAINYDLISDVGDYAKEQSGVTKQPESLRWFFGYLRSLRKPMGQIYLDFGNPVVLDDPPAGDDPLVVSKIAFQIGVETNRVTPITLTSLATMILLGAAPRALTRKELVHEIQSVIAWARARNIYITSHFEPENEKQFASMARVLINNGLITRYDGGPEVVYTITPEQQAVASYYRNTTIHHFVTKAIAELALLHCSEREGRGLDSFWRESDRLRDLFKFEFFYAPTDEFRDQVRQELRRFDPEWEQRLARQPEYARRFLRELRPLVAHGTLTQFVEAYRVVADVATMAPHDAALDATDCANRCFAYGRQAYLQRRISSEASIGKLLFQNGYRVLENRGLTAAGTAEQHTLRAEASQRFCELMHRLQRIQALELPT